MQGYAKLFCEDILRNAYQLIIPIYQRNYSWDKEQCKQLFDDLIQLHNKLKDKSADKNDDKVVGKKIYHFFGSIVYKEIEPNSKYYSLIDGQQRVVTVSLLLKALYEVFKNNESCDKSDLDYIHAVLRPESYVKINRKIRLKPYGNDCHAYDAIINGESYQPYESTKIIDNYKYLYDQVKKSSLSLTEILDVIKKLQVIEILLDDKDDAQLIFESLNSTGKDLSESDKIRNKILMNLTPKEQEDYYNRYWNNIELFCKEIEESLLKGKYKGERIIEEFIRCYFTILLGKIPNNRDLYEEFKKIYSNFKKYNFNSLEDLLKNMLKYAEIYKEIYFKDIGNTEINNILNKLYSLGQRNTIDPYIMQLIYYYKIEAELGEKEMYSILKSIETFLLRRAISNISTNTLNKIFFNLHKSIVDQMQIIKEKGKNEFSYLDVLKYELIKPSRKLPNDESFINNFKEIDLYDKRNIRLYVLTELENELRKELYPKEYVELNMYSGGISIEHILPQTPDQVWKDDLGSKYDELFETYLHRIANLTITKDNNILSNKALSYKLNNDTKYDYTRSGYELTKKTVVDKINTEYKGWNDIPQIERGERFEDFLKTRGELLADFARKRWEMLETQYSPEKLQIEECDEIPLSDDKYNFTNVKIKSFVLFDETIDVTSMADMLIKVIKMLYDKNASIIHNEIVSENSSFILSKKDRDLFIKNNPDRVDAIKTIVEDSVYINTNSDSNTKIKQLRYLFDKYELKYGSDEISQDDLILKIIDEQ